MATAKVFKSGNSQAVRLPKAFRVQGKELDIFRRGDEIVLREPKKKEGLLEVLDLLAALPEDMFEGIKDDRPPQKRKGM
jgi:antitoxin VapB